MLLLADLLMVVAGYIGEQQIDTNGVMVSGPHYLWGFISTVFYLVIPVILYRLYQTYAATVEPEGGPRLPLVGLGHGDDLGRVPHRLHGADTLPRRRTSTGCTWPSRSATCGTRWPWASLPI